MKKEELKRIILYLQNVNTKLNLVKDTWFEVKPELRV